MHNKLVILVYTFSVVFEKTELKEIQFEAIITDNSPGGGYENEIPNQTFFDTGYFGHNLFCIRNSCSESTMFE